MNTPEPCSTCKNLYADCTAEDDPTYEAECKLSLRIGDVDCSKYKNWLEEDERWSIT